MVEISTLSSAHHAVVEDELDAIAIAIAIAIASHWQRHW